MQSLTSVTSELRVNPLLGEVKAKPVRFEQRFLLSVLKSSRLGIRRYRLAIDYLLNEYRSVSAIPSQELVDRCFGLDVVFMYRGHRIGLDITTNPTAVAEKEGKLRSLAPLHRQLGLDHTGVLYVPAAGLSPGQLKDLLSALIRNKSGLVRAS